MEIRDTKDEKIQKLRSLTSVLFKNLKRQSNTMTNKTLTKNTRDECECLKNKTTKRNGNDGLKIGTLPKQHTIIIGRPLFATILHSNGSGVSECATAINTPHSELVQV